MGTLESLVPKKKVVAAVPDSIVRVLLVLPVETPQPQLRVCAVLLSKLGHLQTDWGPPLIGNVLNSTNVPKSRDLGPRMLLEQPGVYSVVLDDQHVRVELLYQLVEETELGNPKLPCSS